MSVRGFAGVAGVSDPCLLGASKKKVSETAPLMSVRGLRGLTPYLPALHFLVEKLFLLGLGNSVNPYFFSPPTR